MPTVILVTVPAGDGVHPSWGCENATHSKAMCVVLTFFFFFFFPGFPIKTEKDAYRACRWLHARGPKTVFITSATWGEEKKLYLIASTSKSSLTL